MVVSKTFRINQLATKTSQALFKAFRLRNPAQRCDFFSLEMIEAEALAIEDVLKIQRMMNAFDHLRPRIMFSDPPPEAFRISIAFSNENVACPRQVRWGLTQ